MISFGVTDKGRVRNENQDSYIIESCEKRKCLTIAICDGMGGAKAGDLASRLACKAFVSHVYEALVAKKLLFMKKLNYERLLKDSCAEANGVVYEYSCFGNDYKGMGTTLVGGIVSNNKAHIVNIGDSRAYVLRPDGIKQITKDHSYVEELISIGALKREEAAHHPKKNIITRALGVDASVKADYFEVELQKGDCILLCSDGLSNMMTDYEIWDSYLKDKTPEAICRNLLNMTLYRGARDNVSIVVVRI